MSFLFEAGDETLWEAGYVSGRMYFALAQGVADHLRVSPGLTGGTPRGDCQVDVSAFRSFVEHLYREYSSTQSVVLHDLLRGMLITSLIMLERAGAPITLEPEHEEAFQQEKAVLARAMG
ncbi:DUF6086 family protein [Streptomyces rubradiris]|uniref:Uncharacterized protein n=1 Tax=Streptomyces rubradiris TaxID=285531 RepID=A0ABQ3RBM5_STRRR|nr:DUF6086 family protein [Streptomyces rubradiris]GHH28129.1 hypothetical protein GCM10018792_71440 [Streptomyces rubradiris]GHI53257.1 hypothetical protein Srubr_31030 [Streptomyces rubradiris]